jgi:8-amino-7-oxononanoate synthase
VDPLAYLEAELAELERASLLRVPPELVSRETGALGGAAAASTGPERAALDACSNDYLGYAAEPISRETLLELEEERSGAGASRLIHGTHAVHLKLERELAAWVGLPSALLFSSGYAACVSLLPALARPQDLIVSDELNHASIIDGCRLSRARVAIVPHQDLAGVARALDEGARAARKWVVVESYYSMDGDSPDLPALREICSSRGAALVVDEAHALGALGPEGRGVCARERVVPDVLIGTLGKAVGMQGAFVAGSERLRLWLWNKARGLVFSTATSPLLGALTLRAVRRARGDADGRARLARAGELLRERLKQAGVPVAPRSYGHILPVPLRAPGRAVAMADLLVRRGIRAQAIRPPTVPEGTSRLRVTVRSTFDDRAIDRLATALEDAWRASS